jgi:hypothetical protein
MSSDSVQRLDYVEAPPRVSSKLKDAFFSCGAAANLHSAAEDDFLACEYCVQVRVLPICVVQLRHCILAS